ncbi:MAG: LEM-3-like GIY-YIG domain-containing protein [Bacteroidota bacterium]
MITSKNEIRGFDPLQSQKLGNYIYALRDPRDGKVFYVGQGKDNRIFQHFEEAQWHLSKGTAIHQMSSKTIRIIDIWKNNEDVEWFIVAYDLPDKLNELSISDIVESAVYDILAESQNGEPLNENSPPHSSRLSPEELIAFAAPLVSPNIPLPFVFIFPIQNAIQGNIPVYEATRSAWKISIGNQSNKPAVAVGLKNSISIGSFEIADWIPSSISSRYEFTAPGHPYPQPYQILLNKNWNTVIAAAKGYWQRGNPLLVEFDGNGRFRVLLGSQDKNSWHNCI